MTASSIDIFVERCEARAQLWAAYQIDLHTAVDVLQDAAERDGLVGDIGQDRIQRVMSDAFNHWRHS